VLLACSCAFWAAGLAAVGAGSAGAETFKAETSEQFEEAVAKANATTGANTIVVKGGVNILALKPLSFTNKTGTQTIEGPASAPGAKLEGSSVEPFPSQLLTVSAGATLALKKVLVSHSSGPGPPAIEVLTEGHLIIEESGVEGNKGIGIINQPGGSLNATNSTISDQAAGGVVNGGTASFVNSTVAFNQGVGVENKGTLNLTDTIVAENTGEQCVGKANTQDHSLDSDRTCGVEKSGVNPLLSAIQLNGDGGPVPIHSLKPGSPAIDGGDEKACPAVDQRDFPRPDVAGTPCDIGADEYSAASPVIKTPAEIVVTEEGSGQAVVNYSVEVTDSGGLATVTCIPAAGSSFPVGTTSVKCTAVDGHENQATAAFNVKVNPKAPPTIEGVPANIEAAATGPTGAVVTYKAPTASSTEGPVAVSCMPGSGSTFPIGATTVTCTAEDKAGKASASFTVTVTDRTPPVIGGVPGETEAEATSSDGAAVTYTNPTATDIVDGKVPVSCAPPSGSTFPVGTTAVKCTVKDKAGNQATASFNVKVHAKTTPPPPTVEPTPPSPAPEAVPPASPGAPPKGAPAPVQTGLPAPVLARSLDLAPVTGQVSIRLPGARRFTSLSAARQVPVRTVVETAHGEVSVTAATARHGTETGEFFDGEFMLTQARNGRVLATLTGGNFAVCPRTPSSRRASAGRLVRRLWAEVGGSFGTTGRYATGIVHGAQWLTEDMCEGTLILATRNRVEVTDFVRHRHVEALPGDVYIAKAG
jgi:hypothetical protein